MLQRFPASVAAVAIGFFVAAVVIGCDGKPSCPEADASLKSSDGSRKPVHLELWTKAPGSFQIYWLSYEGKELLKGTMSSAGRAVQNSAPGHAFRIYTQNDDNSRGAFVMDYTLTSPPNQQIEVQRLPKHCRPPRPEQRETQTRSAEFMELHEGFGGFPPCPEGVPSARWSCVRHILARDCDHRHQNYKNVTDGKVFGFHKQTGKWPPGSFEDHEYDFQMPEIPVMTKGPGFLPMNFTQKMREALYPWYQDNVASAQVAIPVEGGYLNDAHFAAHFLALQSNPKGYHVINEEMQAVLEWWCHQELEHTSTFGVRIYKRGSTLLTHVDRMDTHLASAVIQVAQDLTSKNGSEGLSNAWPVEMVAEDGDCYEVYMQPGQMVLYEGARLKHGRPMRFRGESFGNIFIHFKPPSWRGVDMDRVRRGQRGEL